MAWRRSTVTCVDSIRSEEGTQIEAAIAPIAVAVKLAEGVEAKKGDICYWTGHATAVSTK